MESNGNQNLPPICKSGCGFYGNPAFEGHCSKCYKDIIKRKNETGSPVSSSSAGRMSPIVTEKEAQVTSVTSSLAHASLGSSSDTSIVTTSSTTPSVETATPTVPCTSKSDSTLEEGAVGGATESASITSDSSSGASEEDKDKKPKKNRCHTCKKKVGLTGFPCRCGGLFCSTHRYSDKHECSFNYKEMAQEHIRKHNPVIVADKIQKI